jgi:hypothetical protein
MDDIFTNVKALNDFAVSNPEVTDRTKLPVQIALRIVTMTKPIEPHKKHLLVLLTDADNDTPRKQRETGLCQVYYH